MNARRLLLLSLGLNVALALACAWLARPTARRAAAHGSAAVAGGQQFERLRSAGTPPAEFVEVNPPFHWSELESPELAVFVANLRAIGCPEPTVRDLVVAEVNDRFAARVRALADPVLGRFWHLMLNPEEFERLVDAKKDELSDMETEREQLFRALLGTSDPNRDLVNAESEAEEAAKRTHLTDFLPPDKAAALEAIRVAVEARVKAALAETPKETREARTARIAAIRAQGQAEEKALLLPHELEELALRRFANERNAHDRYAAVLLSEDESRALAQVEHMSSQLGKEFPARSPERAAAVAAAWEQAETRRRELLGTERYAAFERSRQPGYDVLARVAERLGLPPERVNQALDLRQQAAAQAAALWTGAAELDPAARGALVEQLRQESEGALRQTLGDQGFEAYREHTDAWDKAFAAPKPGRDR
jgi:hypothetical protein